MVDFRTPRARSCGGFSTRSVASFTRRLFPSQERLLMNTEGMLKPALIGGVLLGILSSLPVLNLFNCFCCAWIVGGGLLAAYLYVKDSPSPLSLGSGVAIGLFAGIIGAIVSVLFLIPLHFLIGSGMGFTEQAREAIEQIPSIPNETREAMRSLLDRGFIYFLLIFELVRFCLFAMLGGAIGVAIFEKRKPGDAPNNHTSYQPPAALPPAKPPDEQ